MAKPLKSNLEKHIAAKIVVKEEPGYFDGATLVRGPIYRPYLNGAVSTPVAGGYIQAAGAYRTREQARAAAEWIKKKSRQWLDEGNYEDDTA